MKFLLALLLVSCLIIDVHPNYINVDEYANGRATVSSASNLGGSGVYDEQRGSLGRPALSVSGGLPYIRSMLDPPSSGPKREFVVDDRK